MHIDKQKHLTYLHMLTFMHRQTLMHTHFYGKQSLSGEFYFQAGSKNLCLAQAALEQITVFAW